MNPSEPFSPISAHTRTHAGECRNEGPKGSKGSEWVHPGDSTGVLLTIAEARLLLSLCHLAVPETPAQLEVAARLSVLLALATKENP